MGIHQSLRLSLAAIATAVVATTGAHAATAIVPGTSNVFKASPTGGGDGTTPFTFSLAPGSNRILTFTSVVGLTNFFGGTPSVGPDGEALGVNVFSSGGISGMAGSRRQFLTGVFISSAVPPSGTAPARPNPVSQSNQTVVTPALNQSFFIGDGVHQPSGMRQDFIVPNLADTLVLGFLDAAGFFGAPGFYNDNNGSLTAVFGVSAAAPVPLPGALPFMAAGLAGLFGIRRRKRS